SSFEARDRWLHDIIQAGGAHLQRQRAEERARQQRQQEQAASPVEPVEPVISSFTVIADSAAVSDPADRKRDFSELRAANDQAPNPGRPSAPPRWIKGRAHPPEYTPAPGPPRPRGRGRGSVRPLPTAGGGATTGAPSGAPPSRPYAIPQHEPTRTPGEASPM